VGTYPTGFVPDLRRLRQWPSLRNSLWRSPALVRLTYGALARLIQAKIGPTPSRILYVGPGLGHIALELARAGHDVTGIEVDEESVALATRAAARDPLRDGRGPLAYVLGEFPEAAADWGPFDRVLFSRVLHHVADPTVAVRTAARVLGPQGRVVCADFAHDRLGAAGARWLARHRRELSAFGWWPGTVGSTLEEETRRVSREWRDEHEGEDLNPLRTMTKPIEREFRLRRLAWHPYLFWGLAAEMRVPSGSEERVARALRDEEVSALRRGELRGVLFSTTGARRLPSGSS
jgi:2-polyprenyl-3-methyl-5-hydroxy-6-metoxy-1,4-benzoquinol methylase